MTLYPETIGYVDQSDQNPLGKVEERISQMIDFEGGVAGAFYHPYLGMKYLPELVDQMERIPNSEWLDIKKTKQTVKTDKVEIHTSGDGTIQVKSKVSAIETFSIITSKARWKRRFGFSLLLCSCLLSCL